MWANNEGNENNENIVPQVSSDRVPTPSINILSVVITIFSCNSVRHHNAEGQTADFCYYCYYLIVYVMCDPP